MLRQSKLILEYAFWKEAEKGKQVKVFIAIGVSLTSVETSDTPDTTENISVANTCQMTPKTKLHEEILVRMFWG